MPKVASIAAFALNDPTITSLTHQLNQFDYWFDETAHAGQDAILFGDTWRPLTPDLAARFTEVIPLAEIPVIRGGKEIDRHQIYLGRGFKPRAE